MAALDLISHFDIRARLGLAEELKKPESFFVKNFFNRVKTFVSKKVDLDIMKRTRRMSAFVREDQEGNYLRAEGYSTKTVEAPYLKPKMLVTASDVQKRLPSMEIYDDGADLAATIADLVAEYVDVLDSEVIVRNEEWMARQALIDGKIIAVNEDKVEIASVDFKRTASLQAALTGTDKWSDASSDKLQTLRDRRRLVSKESGFSPRLALLGTKAADLFLADEKIQKILSQDWSKRGNLDFDMRDDNAVWLGTADGFDFWMFEEFIINPVSGDEELIMPEEKVLLGSTSAPATRVYGGISANDDNGLIVRATERFVDMYPSEKRDVGGTVVQVHSAPLMVTNHPDAYAAFDVIDP